MSKSVYIGVDGVARKVKKMYIGVDGVARKVKKGYIGVDGVARLFYTSGPRFAYTGDWSVSSVEIDGAAYDLYTLTTSGALTLGENAQYWMCDGGEDGWPDSRDSDVAPTYVNGGRGGAGGKFGTGSIGNGEYVVTIGAAESATTIVGDVETFITDTKGSGYGAGGAIKQDGTRRGSSGGSGGNVNTIPFGISDLQRHCAGGGGGNTKAILEDGTTIRYNKGGAGGSNGSKGSGNNNSVVTSDPTASSGGSYGAGKGATFTTSAGDGTFYGAGGGGASGGYDWATSSYISGKRSVGDGYQGVCYILLPA